MIQWWWSFGILRRKTRGVLWIREEEGYEGVTRGAGEVECQRASEAAWREGADSCRGLQRGIVSSTSILE